MRDNDLRILSILRRQGPLAKAELSRLTGLSAQTMTTAMKRLAQERLVRAEPKVRGKIGQPSIPWTLNPAGAFAIGLKIGRRRLEFALADFTGRLIWQTAQVVSYPTPDIVLKFLDQSLDAMASYGGDRYQGRIIGLGLSIPPQLWEWGDLTSTPQHILERWRNFDVANHFSTATGLAVHLIPDTMAAATAETLSRSSAEAKNFAHFHIGWFAGGAIVLDGKVFRGPNGTAGAIGSLLIATDEGNGAVEQLLARASLKLIDEAMRAKGAPGYAVTGDFSIPEARATVDEWILQAAPALAQAIVSVTAVMGLSEVVIDGAFNSTIREQLVEKTQEAHQALDTRGLGPVRILPGLCGPDSRVAGAALLPILNHFELRSVSV